MNTTETAHVNNQVDDHAPANNERYSFVKGLIQIFVIIAVLGLALLFNKVMSTQKQEAAIKASGPQELLVEIMQPKITNTALRVSETGSVQVRNSVALSPQVKGRVVYVSPNLAVGGKVKNGEVLFKLEAVDYQALVDQAQANVLGKQSDLEVELAEAQIAKQEWELVSPGEIIPPLVARGPQITRARASLASARSSLNDAKVNLGRTKFSLPFSGRVMTTDIELGQTLNAGQNYGQIYSLGSLELSLPIDSKSLASLQPIIGREAEITFKNRTQKAPIIGTVIREDSQLNSSTRLARIIITFSGKHNILPGTFADVMLVGEPIENTFALPITALGENQTIWVASNNTLQARRPKVLSIEADQVITKSFDYADGVITTPIISPKEGRNLTLDASRGE